MAKGLKLGDLVTVREEMRMPRKSEVYQQGLKRLKPGDVGQIVDTVAGQRSVVVEFTGGKRVKLASQRLERAAPSAGDGESNGKDIHSADSEGQQTTHEGANLIDYKNPNLITTVANRLLLSGGLQPDSDAVVVQIKLSDLPGEVQRQVKSLMHEKLALGPQAQRGAGQQPRRRGRKPKNQKP